MFKAFRLFITTVQALTKAIESNTAEQSLLRERLDTIKEHTHYLAKAKKSELARQGHRV